MMVLFAVLLALSSSAIADSEAPSLNSPYTMTLGDMICLEISPMLQTISAKSDAFGMILTSYDSEAAVIRVEIRGAQDRAGKSIETAKRKIETIRQILDQFLIPRSVQRHGPVVSGDDFAISVMSGTDTVLVFDHGKYVLGG